MQSKHITLMQLTALSLLGLTCAVQAATDHHSDSASKPKPFKHTAIQPDLHLYEGNGGNILVSEGPDGLVVIDAGYKDSGKQLDELLSKLGDIEFVINTHWHGDHTGGNYELGHHGSIIAHENVRKRLSTQQEVKQFKMKMAAYPDQAKPDITFKDQFTLHHNTRQFDLQYYPGSHTDSDAVVRIDGGRIIHTGDIFFNGFFPFVDIDSGARVEKLIQNLQSLLPTIDSDAIIIPGHGPVATKAELKAYLTMLEKTHAAVADMMTANQDIKAMQSQGLDKQWQAWTDGPIDEKTWIKTLARSIKQTQAEQPELAKDQ